jgi:hypothetical protein
MPEDATTLSVPENPLKDDITRLLDGGPAAEPEAHPLLSSIGRYWVVRLLGEGGMGAVFWLNLQSLCQTRLVQKKSGSAIKARPTIKDFQPAQLQSAT